MSRKILGISADWRALFFCVLAACTFWFLNAMNHDYTDSIYYPLRVEYDKDSFIPLEKLPKRVRLNVTGYGWTLLHKSFGLKKDAIALQPTGIPFRNYITSTELTPIIKEQIAGIKLNAVLEDTLYFHFDRLVKKKVKVYTDSSSFSLAPSYEITSPVVIIPDTIIYQGPSTLLKKIPDSITIKVPKDYLKEDYDAKIKIPDNSKDYRVKLLHKDVRLQFTVNSFAKESRIVSLRLVNFPSDTMPLTFDRQVIVTYNVKQEDKNKIDSHDFEVYIDYRTMDKSDSTIKPTLVKKPSFVNNFYISPYAIKIKKGK